MFPLISPIAFGPVDIGSMKAQEATRVAGSMKNRGFTWCFEIFDFEFVVCRNMCLLDLGYSDMEIWNEEQRICLVVFHL